MEVLRVEKLDKTFSAEARAGHIHAVNQVSFRIARGEFVALAGESGSGKSTLARLLSGLIPADSGEIFLDGQPLSFPYRRETYQKLQMVFQLPADSFDPRQRLGKVLEGTLRRFGYAGDRKVRAAELFSLVGLPAEYLEKLPHQLSGGECQRAALARALAAGPKLLICDEITSALDVSVQAQIVDLLLILREKLGLSVLFISHDLALAQGFCDRILVMKDGCIVEEGPAREVLGAPRAAYTRQLIDAVLPL